MRKLIIGCAVGVVLSIIGLTVGAEWFISWSNTTLALPADCKSFVDQTVVDITSDWDPNAFIWHVDPRTFESGDEGEIETLFQHYSQLGRLVAYHGAQGELFESEAGQFHFRYTAEADFQNGPATLILEGIRLEEDWYLQAINVQSPALTDQHKKL
jgi:hypothetical protein